MRKELTMHARHSMVFTCVLALSIVSALCVCQIFAQETKVVRVSGSRYVYYAILDLARPFMEKHPDVRVEVTSTEVDAAVNRLTTKAVHAVMTFGELDEERAQEAMDKGMKLVKHTLGAGAVALIVHRENPVDALTVDQVKKIYSAEYTNWDQVGGAQQPIAIITRDDLLSGTEEFFRNRFLGGFPFPQTAIRVHDHDVVRPVWREKGAIADARASEALRGQTRGMVKILAVKKDDASPAVMPYQGSLQDGAYPFSGPLVVYYDQRLDLNLAKRFVEYCAANGLGNLYSSHR